MSTAKKPTPPVDVINEDSGPPLPGTQEQQPNNDGVDIDDAQIEEPRDDAFKKSAQPEEPKRRRKRA
jgi:hypothetical protein